MSHKILGIDIGGTGIKLAIVDTETGKMLTDRIRVATPKPASPEAVVDLISEWVLRLDWKGPIGCGFPSIIKNGVATTATNVDKSWIGLNINTYFSKILNTNCTVINDADAAGLAEMEFGAGKDKKGVVLLLTLGTGIGSALFIDGKLVPNTEMGHLFFKDAIAEKYTSNRTRKIEELNWVDWGNRLNEYLQHIDRLFSPEFLILGGGVSKEFKKYKKYLKTDFPIVPAQQKNAAGVIGAALAARIAIQK